MSHSHDPDSPSSDSLQERLVKAALEARCQRCEVVILEDSSKAGVVFGRLLVPVLGVKHAYQLCGKCGLALREFLFPRLLDDPNFVETKRQLLTEWS